MNIHDKMDIKQLIEPFGETYFLYQNDRKSYRNADKKAAAWLETATDLARSPKCVAERQGDNRTL